MTPVGFNSKDTVDHTIGSSTDTFKCNASNSGERSQVGAISEEDLLLSTRSNCRKPVPLFGLMEVPIQPCDGLRLDRPGHHVALLCTIRAEALKSPRSMLWVFEELRVPILPALKTFLRARLIF